MPLTQQETNNILAQGGGDIERVVSDTTDGAIVQFNDGRYYMYNRNLGTITEIPRSLLNNMIFSRMQSVL